MIGNASECMRDKQDENVERMMTYIASKYEEPFRVVDYIPAKIGFNHRGLYRTLVVTSDQNDTTRMNITEWLSKQGVYEDNYITYLLSSKIHADFDFSNIIGLYGAKVYMSIIDVGVDIQQLKELPIREIIKQYRTSLSCIIFIKDKYDEQRMKSLYAYYEQLYEYGATFTYFKVGFTDEDFFFQQYVENYPLYGVQEFYDVDKTVYAYLSIWGDKVTFKKFMKSIQVLER